MRSVIRKIYTKIISVLRRLYYRRCRKRLTNKTPTIISSDCFGSIVYHNLGLYFRSPTINLFFSGDDFITFVQNLKPFLEAELIEDQNCSAQYPVGELTCKNQTIKVHFMHYPNFEEAKRKWDERKLRVDFSNIYIILLLVTATKKQIEDFEKLPYKHKMLITKDNPTNSEYVVTHPMLAKADYRAGNILNFKSRFSFHRHMDEIDYIGFLNDID